MGTIQAGVIVVTKFCRSQSSQFSSYINYIDRDEAARSENSSHYNLYQDYMENPDKTTGLFTADKNDLAFEEKEQLKELFQTAQDNDSLMWQTVISFDNRFLAENGLYQEEEQILDEDALKNMVRNAVGKMLQAEHLENAVWSGAIHFNTDNIHVHIATVEPDPMRKKREYIQYEEKMADGKLLKVPMRDAGGKIVTKEEYKGTFRPKSIEACKSSIVNEILHEKENNLKINQVIRDSIVKQAKQHTLSNDKDLAHAFLDLYYKMPATARNLWNYNNPVMVPLQPEIDQLATMYLEKYHKEEFAELKAMLQEQDKKYQQAYGNSNRSYAEGKMQDLYTRLGNAILAEIREYDRETGQGVTHDTLSGQTGQGKYYPVLSVYQRVSLMSAIKRMKRGLENEWQKRQNIREHDQMVEQSVNRSAGQEEDK